MIDYDRLVSQRAELARRFGEAVPFRWLYVDGFLLEPWPRRLHDEFGGAVQRSGKRADAPKKHRHVLAKVGIVRREHMHEVHRQFFDAIQEPRFLALLEEITGIKPILCDPSLAGGGLHEVHREGYLNVHTDFNVHPETGLHRRLNLLYYLNPIWRDEWEGALELWPQDLAGPCVSVSPIINRMVIFETSEVSFHGHPRPLRVPVGLTRRSMASYYYSEWPRGLVPRTKTNYRLLPWQVAELTARIERLRAGGLEESAILQELSRRFEARDVEAVMERLRT